MSHRKAKQKRHSVNLEVLKEFFRKQIDAQHQWAVVEWEIQIMLLQKQYGKP